MMNKERIGVYLPQLRRFARALCGSQASGDAYVLAMLECLVEDPSLLNQAIDGRIAVYQLLLKIWGSIGIEGAQEGHDPFGAPLATLTPRSRQAFLLVALEGFSEGEAAIAMNIEADGFARLMDAANSEIADQLATNVLIIEDEPLIAMELEHLVEQLGHKVIDIARTKREAVEIARRQRPGLILSDIGLADGSSGLDAVADILASFSVPVILVTAYPERLLTGTKPEPTYIITKPFQPDALQALISQALLFAEKSVDLVAA